MRKFDIRQWVLVTSFDPLIVYMYNDMYLKLCGSEFTLEDIYDNYRHLSNYTLQKKNTNVNDASEDLTMSSAAFYDLIK